MWSVHHLPVLFLPIRVILCTQGPQLELGSLKGGGFQVMHSKQGSGSMVPDLRKQDQVPGRTIPKTATEYIRVWAGYE